MISIRRSAGAVLLLSALVGLGSPLVSTGAVSTPVDSAPVEKAAPSAPPRPAPQLADALHVTINALTDSLAGSASSWFAGMEVTPDQQGIVIHVVSAGMSQVQAIVTQRLQAIGLDGINPSNVTFVPASASLASLEARQDLLTNAISTLKSEGVVVTAYSPDITNNTLSVSVQDVTQSDQTLIAQIVGAENLTVTNGQIAALSGRTTDSPPWYGGDYIHGSGYCTSGFSMVDSGGVTYSSTAAHCDSTPSHNAVFTQNGQGYGVTVPGKWWRCNNCYGDQELISSYPNTTDGIVWISNSADRPVAAVDGGQQVPGELMCTDGYYTFVQTGSEVCHITITSVATCVPFNDGVTVCGLITASKSGAVVVQPGDSGGPVYNRNSDGSVTARGIVTGNPCGETQCDTVFYTQVATVSFLFGVSPILG